MKLIKKLQLLRKVSDDIALYLTGKKYDNKSVKRLRQRSGLSVEEVADRMNVSYDTAYRICYGKICRKTGILARNMFIEVINAKQAMDHN